MFKNVYSFFLFVSLPVLAAPSGSLESSVPTKSSRVIGFVELRPSFGIVSPGDKRSQLHSENTLSLGYQFSKDVSLSYTQWWNHNVINPDEETTGVNPKTDEGFFHLVLDNLYDNGKGFTIRYEPRLFMPTLKAKRDAGLIAYLRNYVIFKQEFNSFFSLEITEAPLFHFYSRKGSLVDGEPTANPTFENRFYINPIFQFTEKLSLEFPIYYHAARHADYQQGAAKNNSWQHYLWIWPELGYEFTPHYTLGIAYYSENLLKPDFSGEAFDSGFQEGMTQVVLRGSL